ncbi:MAG: hypothetical protein H5T33_01985 [Candidatus Methanosuratus sp.]|nr:hypothetical protein [Candidatus Methanosuratincola sp.]
MDNRKYENPEMGRKMAEESVTPPFKYWLLMLVFLVTVISVGSAIGFHAFGPTFIENMNAYNLYEMGREGRRLYYETPEGEKMIKVDIGFDMNTTYNSTHGVAYWFMGIELPYGSTLMDAIENIHKAEIAEMRVYDLDDTAVFERVIEDPQSINLEIKFSEILSIKYLDEINGTRSDPVTMAQWMTYFWNAKAQSFAYITVSSTNFELAHKDTVVIIYDIFGGWPADCCSGGAWEYDEYTGPT